MKIIEVAVLITCYNRKDKTLICLEHVFKQKIKEAYSLHVFLVDDGSTDGTYETVKKIFPEVNIIQGNGNLYWNQGMRLAWDTASNTSDFDFYVWLNDDTFIDENAIEGLILNHIEIVSRDLKIGVITGACRVAIDKQEFSYGGRNDKEEVIPNGKIQQCNYINGNVVLVPKEVFNALGNLSNYYTHAMGDFDYGLRAVREGFKCYTTKTYIATCAPNVGIPGWCDPQNSFKKRLELLHSPLGLNIKEYIIFRKKNTKNDWFFYTVKAYFKMISPNLYKKIVYELSK
jgi:GT2 family glycosyltransferase